MKRSSSVSLLLLCLGWLLVVVVGLTSAQVTQTEEVITKPTFPSRFRVNFLFMSKDDESFIPPSAAAAFDVTGYPSNWLGRENFTVRGTEQSSFFFGRDKRIVLTSNGYHGEKCYEMTMDTDSLDPHPAYKALKFYMDFNTAPEGKYLYMGKRLARGKLGYMWQDANDPRNKVYEYQPAGADYRIPILLRDGTFDYIFDIFDVVSLSYLENTMTVPESFYCRPAVFKKK